MIAVALRFNCVRRENHSLLKVDVARFLHSLNVPTRAQAAHNI
jgi:hypothetical protein